MAAEMRFEHEFTVDVPLEQAWRALTGGDAVAASLPEAQLRAVDGVHTGRIQLDATRDLACEATISPIDEDEDERVATVSVHGRQVDGPGIGSALLRSRLRDQGASTSVSVTADVLTTGHDPGTGFHLAARAMFESVVEGLERRARQRLPPAASPAAPASLATVPGPAPVAVKAEGTWLERAAEQKRLVAAATGLVIAVGLLRRMRRGRRRI